MGGFIRRGALALIAAAVPALASAQEARVTGRVTNGMSSTLAGG